MPQPPHARDATLALVRESIFRFASLRVGKEDAEELANDTLLLLHTKYPHLDSSVDLVPLALTTIKFKILERLRQRDRGHLSLDGVSPPSGHPNPEQDAGAAQRQSRVMRAVLQLGPRCRLLMLLKLQGYNFIEIMAEMRAGSINTVYTWDRRCREALRKILEASAK